jgi:hypothetical protein
MSRRSMLAVTTALATAASTGFADMPARAQVTRSGPVGSAAAPTETLSSDELSLTGADQFRWLSVPNSRIVLNPYDFNQTTSEVVQNSGPDLPLSAGYYAHDAAEVVKPLLSLYRHPAGQPNPTPPATTFDDEFDTLDPAWTREPGVQASVANSQLSLELSATSPNPWGALSRTLTVDVDAYPIVGVDVSSADGKWSLKVNDGSAAVDTALQTDNDRTGAMTYDLREATGWSGTKTFTLKLFVIERQAPLTVDRIAIQAEPVNWLQSAATWSTTWRPYALDFDASYHGASGPATVDGYDVFCDTGSVARVITSTGLPGPDGAGLTLAGRYDGTVTYQPTIGALTISGTTFTYAIALGRDNHVRYYANEADLRAGGPTLPQPAQAGFWAADLDTARIAIGIGFSYAGEQGDPAIRRALAAASNRAAHQRRLQWRRYWDAVLQHVPRPLDFDLLAGTPFALSAQDVRAAYYRAWVFTQSNVLPPGPEVNYSYPQVAAGKPSMWNGGAPGATASASWDSLLGIQYLAYLDPRNAWASLQGLMSLVDATGKLGGESLPSRKAQTAWMLYAVTGDRRRLTGIYPALRRHLIWAQANPRWIIPGHDITDERDAEFVVSLLVDLTFAERIAGTAGHRDDVSFWRQQRAQLLADYGSWFFPADGSGPLQYHYLQGSHPDSRGNSLWVLTGLHADGITDSERAALIALFDSHFDPSALLAGWSAPDVKAPDVTYTCYGLLDAGKATDADRFAQAMLAGVIKAGQFAEVYEVAGDGTAATGVRPSLFGAINLIDFVWLLNGYRADQGMPLFVNLAGTNGGITSLHTDGLSFGLVADAGAGVVRLSGPAIKRGDRCSVLPAPVGSSVPLSDACRA